MELYVIQELNKWGNLCGEKLTLEHSLNHTQRMVYVVLYILCGLAINLTWSGFVKHLDKFLPL